MTASAPANLGTSGDAPLGCAVAQTDAEGRMTRWALDDLGRATSRTLPLGQTETMAYDAAGNLIQRTAFDGATTLFSYDALDREILRDYPSDPDITTAYTATGQLASRTDGRGTTTYSYDVRDRLLRIDYPSGSHVAYGYDPAGNRASVSYPNGVQTSDSYHVRNRLRRIETMRGLATVLQGLTYTLNANGTRASLIKGGAALGVLTCWKCS